MICDFVPLLRLYAMIIFDLRQSSIRRRKKYGGGIRLDKVKKLINEFRKRESEIDNEWYRNRLIDRELWYSHGLSQLPATHLNKWASVA